MGCCKMEERLVYRNSRRYYNYKATDFVPIFGPLFYMGRIIAGAENLTRVDEIFQEIIPRAGILIAYDKGLDLLIRMAIT